ncbi:putative oxidase [Mycena vitilis]|nr:putative oxidase [Mycena vitilis]
MHPLSLLVALAVVSHPCAAFPPSYFEGRPASLANRTLGGFSTEQLIDVVGAHSFKPPGDGDLRGPCPGLNAMANHNYIPHNGVVTFTDAIHYSELVFGLGFDTATLAAILALFGADLPTLTFSIGGPPKTSFLGGILGGILGRPTGLTGTHNQFESDSSVVRGDYYQFNGDNYHVQLSYFQGLYNLQPVGNSSDYNLGIIQQHRVNRFHQSVAQNPYFFYGPVQMLISCLAHNFVPALMSNHSAEHPNGYLDGEVLKSIFSITTSANGTLSYTPGHERLPNNWYRRPFLDEYTAVHVIPDFLAMWTRFPETLLIGGNINGVNTYAPMDIYNLTGGVYNAAMLLEGDNAACFLYQTLQILVPDALTGLAGIVETIVTPLFNVVRPILAGLTCPELKSIDRSVMERYPGYRRTSHAV